jgi:hypothetical protein
MTDEELALANEQLRDPPEFKLTSTARLGLYVVGQLALRHGIRVRLTESPYGGTTAIVLLPATIMFGDGIEAPDGPADEPERAPALVLNSGRHRLENVAARAQLASSAAVRELEEGHSADPWRSFVTAAASSSEELVDPKPGAAAPRRDEPTTLTPSGLPFRHKETSSPRPPAPISPVPLSPAPLSPVSLSPVTQPSTVVPVVPGQPRPADVGAPAAANGVDHTRPPEEVRSMMASYRSGTLRGRTEAARMVEAAESSTVDAEVVDDVDIEPEPRLPDTDEGG